MTTDSGNRAAFRNVVKLLGEKRQQGLLYIALLPPFPPIFELPPDEQTTLCKASNVSEREFGRLLGRIGEVISVVLEDDEEIEKDYIDERVERAKRAAKAKNDETVVDEAAVRAEVSEELSIVKSELVDAALRKRYTLKVTSKAPSFTNLDWDIKIKKYDAKHDIEYPYATCKFKVQRDFELTPIALLSGRQFDALQVNFTSGDLDYVLRVLKEVRDRLHGLEEASP